MPAQGHKQQRHASPDSSGGLARLQSRRSHAFAVGEALTLERKISADAYVFLYKELVRLCKEGSRCWPGLDWLVERLGTSEGTIKRWLAELVKAQLIRRTPRAGGMTTLTTVVALEAIDANDRKQSDENNHEQSGNGRHAASIRNDDNFFLPARERKSGPPDGSQSISLNRFKTQKTNRGGGTTSASVDITQSARLLQREGVIAPEVLDELKHVPIEAIERCFAVARSRPQVVDPAGFAVAMLRRGAACSMDARQHHDADDMRSRPAAEKQAPLGIVHASAPGEAQTIGLGDLWRRVLDRVRASVDGPAFETWCSDTTLEVLDTVAVVGTATCFQRDALERQFDDHIGAALAANTGQVRDVRYVIRSRPRTSV